MKLIFFARKSESKQFLRFFASDLSCIFYLKSTIKRNPLSFREKKQTEEENKLISGAINFFKYALF